jgi:hypothetical protein
MGVIYSSEKSDIFQYIQTKVLLKNDNANLFTYESVTMQKQKYCVFLKSCHTPSRQIPSLPFLVPKGSLLCSLEPTAKKTCLVTVA